MTGKTPSRALTAAFACVVVAGIMPATAGADRVSSGAPELRTPSGNAGPVHKAPPAEIAPKLTLDEVNAGLAPPSARPSGKAAPSAPISSAQLSFNGSNQTQSLRPPDTHGAVGLTEFVQVTNSKLEVFNKLTGAMTKTVTLNSFCNYTTTTMFDPRVIYDKVWNRWIVVVEAFPEPAPSTQQILCVAASTGSSATGSFRVYKFNAPRFGVASNFYDYPMAGMDQDAILISANIFNSSDSNVGSNVMGIPKAALYNGRSFSVPVHNAGLSGTLAVPIVEGNHNPAMLVATPASGNTIGLYKASNQGRSNAALSARVNVPVNAFTAAGSAAQPGTTNRLDVLNRFVDHSTQIAGHVLNAVARQTIPENRWYQINGTTNTKFAEGVFFQNATSHDWNPSIAGSPVGGTSTNPIGRMFYTWSATDPSNPTVASRHNARVKGGGRLATDSTTQTGGATLFTSSTFYNPTSDTVERWGDYSSTTLDPTAVTGCVAGQRAYITNEKINSTTLWGNRFGRLGFC